MYSLIFQKTMHRVLTYRSEFFIGIIGSIFYVYVQVSIWRALLSTGMGGDISLQEMVTYVIIAFAVRGMTHSDMSYIMSDKIKTGQIAMDFIRPIHLIGYQFAEQLSTNCIKMLTQVMPALILSAVAWGFMGPASVVHLLFFIISLVFSVLIMFYLEYIFGLLVFWAKNGTYTDFIMGGLFTVFSGATIPLWFYPEWLRRICDVLPFRLITFEPLQIYLGRLTPDGAFRVLLLQLLWLVFLAVLERLIWSRVQNLVFVQGG